MPHIELVGLVEEKVRDISNALNTSMQNAATKLILSIADEALENIKKFNAQFDDKTKKEFLEVFNGTVEQLNKKKKREPQK